MTRHGKIARLPRPIREQLNQRIDNGETGVHLVAWLNALPEVQSVLAAHFEGAPINEQNLSAWKQGGFVDWLRHQQAQEWVGRLVEESDDLEAVSGPTRLAARFAVPLLMQLSQLLQTAADSDNLAEYRRVALGVARQLTQLRRADHEAERVRIENERWEMEKEAAREKQRRRRGGKSHRHPHSRASLSRPR